MSCTNFLVWGNNNTNLLSPNSQKCLSTPIPLSLPLSIVSICASEKHISVLTKQGELYSYGSNLDGRLGVSTRAVQGVAHENMIRVQIPGQTKVIRVQSGFSHMCVLTQGKEVYAWGLGDYGALGTGEFKSRSVPTRVELPRELVGKLRQISCGAMHTAFLFEDGDVYTCGSNQYGQLGVNKPQKVSTPIPISFHLPVIQVSCGVFYTLLLTRDGKVYGMGNNKYGQLGTGHKVNQCHPTLIRQLSDIVKVTAGYHSGAVDKFGNLYIWGSGSFGELLRPKKFVLSVPIKDIAIRGFFGIAIGHTSKNQNRIYSWGNNTFGELGVGNYQASKQPQEIQTLRGLEVNKIALGVNFAMVLLQPPTERSRYKEPIGQQKSKSQRNFIKNNDQYTEQKDAPLNRSINGFEQKYLNSKRRKSQDFLTVNSKNKDKQFQSIKTNEKRNEYTAIYPERSPERSRERQRQRYTGRESQNIYSRDKQKREMPKGGDNRRERHNQSYREDDRLGSQRNDYQKLFVQLSQDYEILVRKYTDLERQISVSKMGDYGGNKIREKELLEENLRLKDQISKLSYQLILLNDECRTKNHQIQQLAIANQRLLSQQARLSQITLSPRKIAHPVSLSAQIEQQYNKLLTQKQQTISKLTLSLTKSQQQFKLQLARLQSENISLKTELALQSQTRSKIVTDHQLLIDQLQLSLKKSQQLSKILAEQNEKLKTQLSSYKIRTTDFQQANMRAQQAQNNQKWLKEKYEQDIKDSMIKGEALTSRVAQLEVQLQYEKEFNKKYQESILEIKENNQKLFNQLNMQVQSNIEKVGKIENYKQELEKMKRYKKELDEKNIQLQQFSQNFESYKKKTKQILQQKQKQQKQQKQSFSKTIQQIELKLQRQVLQNQDLHRDNNRLQKQLIKGKQNLTAVKSQMSLKQEELEHLQQQKNNFQKKISLLSGQLDKQVQDRENLIKDFGEAKRELAKFKINLGESENKCALELEEKNKLSKALGFKQQQINHIKQQLEKMTQKADNFKKQNTLYRQQVESTSYQLQNQMKINQQLMRANKQFAQSQRQFAQKISQLQNRIYQLEDENKSYTPRYEALLIRNRQLDQRNRQLGQMINKAIQIQAQSYKNNILKQVQINTDNIINQFKQEQEFHFKGRRTKKQKQVQLVDEDGNTTQRQEKSSQIQRQRQREQPYTKMMKQRISQHKRKVSQSAQKLANLLYINDKGKSSIKENRNTEDYEKINQQMESFQNQKEVFMEKINSFAEKLKII